MVMRLLILGRELLLPVRVVLFRLKLEHLPESEMVIRDVAVKDATRWPEANVISALD